MTVPSKALIPQPVGQHDVSQQGVGQHGSGQQLCTIGAQQPVWMMFESSMTLDVSNPILRTGPDGNKPADGTGVSDSNGGSAGGAETGREVPLDRKFVDAGAGRINDSCASSTGFSFGG